VNKPYRSLTLFRRQASDVGRELVECELDRDGKQVAAGHLVRRSDAATDQWQGLALGDVTLEKALRERAPHLVLEPMSQGGDEVHHLLERRFRPSPESPKPGLNRRHVRVSRRRSPSTIA
jgi:hypothetical protein